MIVRRIAQVILVLCVAGCAVVATRHDWPDAVLFGMAGALALVTARKVAWRLRLDHGALTTAPPHTGARPPVEI